MKPLTVKQTIFCEEYAKDGNGTRAYKVAYNAKKMKDTTIVSKASRMIRQDNISARIGQLQEDMADKHEVSRDWIIIELKDVIKKAGRDEPIIRDSTIIGYKRPDTTGINKALDTLNKMMGYYAAEKHEHSGAIDLNMLSSRLKGKKSD